MGFAPFRLRKKKATFVRDGSCLDVGRPELRRFADAHATGGRGQQEADEGDKDDKDEDDGGGEKDVSKGGVGILS